MDDKQNKMEGRRRTTKSNFQRSDMGAQAAWKGFSSQTFYIAARLISDEQGYEYYPEDIEELVVKKDGIIVEAVQIKNISAALTLSSLALAKTSTGGEGFFYRMCSTHLQDPFFKNIRIVYFGTLGTELQEVENNKEETKNVYQVGLRRSIILKKKRRFG